MAIKRWGIDNNPRVDPLEIKSEVSSEKTVHQQKAYQRIVFSIDSNQKVGINNSSNLRDDKDDPRDHNHNPREDNGNLRNNDDKLDMEKPNTICPDNQNPSPLDVILQLSHSRHKSHMDIQHLNQLLLLLLLSIIAIINYF
eukprot:jgi/Psemu1/60433/gm1.60433_g